MSNPLEEFYSKQEEPLQSCFLALRSIILKFDEDIDERFKYGLPFFYHKSKPFCYFWKDKKTNQPYIGFAKGHLMDHPGLEKGNRKKMKVLMLNVNKDIDLSLILKFLNWQDQSNLPKCPVQMPSLTTLLLPFPS